MNFSTYGPFVVRENSKVAIDELWQDLERAHKRLADGIGVYVFAIRKPSGALTPIYVGKTTNGFVRRISQHLGKGKFHTILETGSDLRIFIVVRVTPAGKPIRTTPKIRKAGLKSINWLEGDLIRSCLKKNADLINLQEKAFHKGLHVPGYSNSSPENYDDAASQFAEMISTK